MSGEALLSLRRLSVRRGRRLVLQDVNLTVLPGEQVALVGPNGGGKTTLLRALHGWGEYAGGQRTGTASKQIAMVHQRPYLLRMSAWRQVALAAWLQGRTWMTARQLAEQALLQVQLSALAQRSADQMSGGEQQRLALARACVRQPRVLLLDEPTANLDPQARAELEALLRKWALPCAWGTDGLYPQAMVFSSHQMAQVKRLASRVLYVAGGRVLVDLPVHDFFNSDHLQALSSEAAQFLQQETL